MWSCARTICVVLIALALSSAASAQQLRIGYVDMKQVLDNAPQVVAGRAKLDQEFRDRNDSIQLDEMRADLGMAPAWPTPEEVEVLVPLPRPPGGPRARTRVPLTVPLTGE